MPDSLFNPAAFEQLPGQVSFEQLSDEPEGWRVTVATPDGPTVETVEAPSASAAVESVQITIDAFCCQGAEVVAVERERAR